MTRPDRRNSCSTDDVLVADWGPEVKQLEESPIVRYCSVSAQQWPVHVVL